MAITLLAVYARNDEAAAIRAALAADAEGEADPMYYLRDELDGQALTEALGGDRDDA
jgi:hypothetical protein